MDEETSKIKQHIDFEREQLGHRIHEIENRVKRATDFRTQFNNNTVLFLGAAFVGGYLLSHATSTSSASASAAAAQPGRTSRVRTKSFNRISETFDRIIEGVSAVVSERLTAFVGDNVPGFRDHIKAAPPVLDPRFVGNE